MRSQKSRFYWIYLFFLSVNGLNGFDFESAEAKTRTKPSSKRSKNKRGGAVPEPEEAAPVPSPEDLHVHDVEDEAKEELRRVEPLLSKIAKEKISSHTSEYEKAYIEEKRNDPSLKLYNDDLVKKAAEKFSRQVLRSEKNPEKVVHSVVEELRTSTPNMKNPKSRNFFDSILTSEKSQGFQKAFQELDEKERGSLFALKYNGGEMAKKNISLVLKAGIESLVSESKILKTLAALNLSQLEAFGNLTRTLQGQAGYQESIEMFFNQILNNPILLVPYEKILINLQGSTGIKLPALKEALGSLIKGNLGEEKLNILVNVLILKTTYKDYLNKSPDKKALFIKNLAPFMDILKQTDPSLANNAWIWWKEDLSGWKASYMVYYVANIGNYKNLGASASAAISYFKNRK